MDRPWWILLTYATKHIIFATDWEKSDRLLLKYTWCQDWSMIFYLLNDSTKQDAVNHHPDPEQSGVYAVINNKINKSKWFPYVSEHSIFFYLKLEQMKTRQFKKQSGYELWHWRLAPSNQTIRDTIKWAIGLESLKMITFETHVKCAWLGTNTTKCIITHNLA